MHVASGWPSHEHLLASSPLQHLDAEINTRPKPSKTPPWGICERKKLERVTWHPCRERERPPGPSSPRWEIYHLTVGFGPQVQNDPPPPPQQPFAPMSCGEGSNKCCIFSWRTPHQWLFSHSVKTTTWFSPMQLWLLGATDTVIVISSKTNLISLSKNAAVFQQLSWVRVVRGLKKLGHRALYAVSQCLGRLQHRGGFWRNRREGGPARPFSLADRTSGSELKRRK